jgi:hypothetical protein
MPNCLSQQITNRNDGDSLVIAHDRQMANAVLMHKSQTICEGMIDIDCHNVASHDIGDRSCLWRLVGYDDSPDAVAFRQDSSYLASLQDICFRISSCPDLSNDMAMSVALARLRLPHRA